MPSASTDAPSGLLSRTTSPGDGAAGVTAWTGAGAGTAGAGAGTTGAGGLVTAAPGGASFGEGTEDGPRRNTPNAIPATTPTVIAPMRTARRWPFRGGTVPAVTLAAAESVVAELEYRRGCAAGGADYHGR